MTLRNHFVIYFYCVFVFIFREFLINSANYKIGVIGILVGEEGRKKGGLPMSLANGGRGKKWGREVCPYGSPKKSF